MESQQSSDVCRRNCVEIVRLLSRDKSNIERWIDERIMNNLTVFAGFKVGDIANVNTETETGRSLSLEAQKALCNLMFQSEKARRLCM
jgi:hypothetical protein